MNIRLTPIGFETLHRAFRQAPDMAREELTVAAREASLLLQSAIVGRYTAPGPAGATHTGLAAGSITADAYSTPVGALGVVTSANPVVTFIELGTRPHTPPIEPLLQWVMDKLGKGVVEGFIVARSIQRKIRAHGTKPRPFFQEELDRHEELIGSMFEDAASRIAQRLAAEGGAA
jgi:hypothetical protein